MNRLVTQVGRLGVLFLFLISMTSAARAQPFFAEPEGIGVGCTDPTDACNLQDAVDAANASAGEQIIFLRINSNGAPAVFDLSDVPLPSPLTITENVQFDIYINDGTSTPPTGQEGTAIIEGNVEIASGVTVSLVENITLELIGHPGVLLIEDGAAFSGEGVLAFTGTNGTYTIFLGDPAINCSHLPPANSISFENVLLDLPGGTVEVEDECTSDNKFSTVNITNNLTVEAGTLDMDNNFLSVVAEDDNTGPVSPGVTIANPGALIQGGGTFLISVEPAASGAIGFANTRTDCFVIDGDGVLDMALEKNTDAGVCIDLSAIGAGGHSENNAGLLFVREATQLNGSFSNEGNARTEFDALETITDDVRVIGPGDETSNVGSAFSNGVCDGNESGVFFFANVTIGGQVELDDTDDPNTANCTEGLGFEAALLNESGTSVIQGPVIADDANGIYLDENDGVFHNLEFQGSLFFDETPTFELDQPAVAFVSSSLCQAYTVESSGNKVIFGGADPQTIDYVDPNGLHISSVAIHKTVVGADVEIDEGAGGVFLIDTTLELISGDFVANGLLDLNGTTDPTAGATIALNRTPTEVGVLREGTGFTAYVDANTLNSGPENLPRKVAYYGEHPRFTADEIPFDASGSLANTEVTLEELEIYLDPAADPVPIITISKDFTVTNRLRLTQGLLQVGSGELTLANEVQIGIGNGGILMPQSGGGELIFPTVAANETNDFGIDLSYFGTDSPHPVGAEWPTDQSNVIRNVEVRRECGSEPLEVTLRDDETFRLNPDDKASDASTRNLQAGLWIYNGSTLDLKGATLEVNAANGNDGEIFVANRGRLRDSEADNIDGISNGIFARSTFAEELDAFKQALRTAADVSLRPPPELYEALEVLRAEQQDAGKTQDHIGLLKYIGDDDTDTFIETSSSQLAFFFPAIEVDRGPSGHVTFDASGTFNDGVNENLDVLSTYAFTLTSAALGNDGDDNTDPDAGGVELLDGLDLLEVRHDYIQQDGEFQMAGLSSLAPPPFNSTFQHVEVGSLGGDFAENDGEFFTDGGDVTTFGNFYLGENMGEDPSDALFSQSFSGFQTVVGNFVVGPNTDSCTNETAPDTGDECVGQATARADEDRNRYFQGGTPGEVEDLGGTILFGDFTFMGTGDVFNDGSFLLTEQGLRGNTIFVGSSPQTIVQRQDEDAFLNDVVMSTGLDAGILLQQDTFQNDTGTLILEIGLIDTDDETWEWVVLNPSLEPDLHNRNNAARGMGVVTLGSPVSYINSPVSRVVEEGGEIGGGNIFSGYLFPVGTQRLVGDLGDFRPLILQFPDDLALASVARVDHLQEEQLPSGLELPEGGLIVDAMEGTLELNTVAEGFFWRLEFDRLPSFDPNIRLGAQGLRHVFEVKSLRIIQWDCDGSNPRLAGHYNLNEFPNDFIDNVSNLTQEGIEVEACQIFGIATDGAINPINSTFARVLGKIALENETPVPGVLIDILGLNSAGFSTNSGVFGFPAFVDSSYTVTPQNDGSIPGANNRGVDVGDILAIRQHILNNTLLPSPYAIIAADATHDDNVNVGDILATRQLILNETIPNGGLWRFINSDFTFNDPNDPFADVPFDTTRTYDPLSGPEENQDFVAIKKGDVNASWTAPAPPGVAAKRAPQAVASSGVVRLSVSEQSVSQATGEEVLVAVRASSFEDVAAYQMTLSWDASVLEYAGVSETGLPGLSASSFGVSRVEEGLMTTLWDDARGAGQTLLPGSSLFVLRFRVVGVGDRSVSVGSSLIPARAYRGADMALLSVEADGMSVPTELSESEVPLQYALGSNYPNPFNPETTIGYVLREGVSVRLSVYDVLGREVAVLVEGVQEAGRHEARFDGSGLPSGVYYYRLEAGTFRAAKQMLMLK